MHIYNLLVSYCVLFFRNGKKSKWRRKITRLNSENKKKEKEKAWTHLTKYQFLHRQGVIFDENDDEISPDDIPLQTDSTKSKNGEICFGYIFLPYTLYYRKVQWRDRSYFVFSSMMKLLRLIAEDWIWSW